MSPGSVVVTGANRGIGLGLVEQLLKDKNIRHVIATARDVENASDLNSIGDPRLHVLALSVSSDESMDHFVREVTKIVGADGLNLLVNNAGIAIKYDSKSEPNRSLLTEQFDVNAVSVVLLTQKLLSLLTTAASRVSGDDVSISRAAVINISSGQGSITNNTGSGALQNMVYRMTKTAINQFTRTFSIDLKDEHILAVSMAPGWVQTGMGGGKATFTVEESTSQLVSSFYRLNSSHNGGFFNRDLSSCPF